VITPDGWIYEKEAILEYILSKKLENSRLLKAFENQKNQKDKDVQELMEIQKKERLEKFLASEGRLVASIDPSKLDKSFPNSTGTTPSTSSTTNDDTTTSKTPISNMSGEFGKKLPSFWVPSLCPDSKTKVPMKKPNTVINCPMSNKPISIKDLTDVKFKLFEDASNSNKALISRENRYVCPISNDILSNSVPCVVLKTSGCVITQDALERIVKKDMIDPINSKKLSERDIIPIQRGGTGYAGNGVKLNFKKVAPSMIS